MLHNSHEFLPFVIFLKAPIVEDPDAITEENGNEKVEVEPSEETLIQNTSIVTTIVSKISILKWNNLHCILKDPKARRLYLESEAIREEFEKYFDMEITFDDLESALSKVKEALKKLTSETQWVPRNWVYS